MLILGLFGLAFYTSAEEIENAVIYNLTDEPIRVAVAYDGRQLMSDFVTIEIQSKGEIKMPAAKFLRNRVLFATTDRKLTETNFKDNIRTSFGGPNTAAANIGRLGQKWLGMARGKADDQPEYGEVFVFRGEGDRRLQVTRRQSVPWYHRDDLVEKIKKIAPDLQIKA